ncbi:MAG: hypothetical protein SF053_03215, partial [Bacteroidia bacterium]|nr:hypothetical protein [Bacteroidia bacterium]
MLDILGLYKVLKTRDLTSEESGWVTAWLKKYPYFAYAHFLKARETGDEAALFQAAVYAPVRPLLRRFMEDTAPIDHTLPVSGDNIPPAGGLHPAVRLPLTMYLPVVVADHTLPAWGVHIPGRPDGRGYAFLNHWLGVEVQ